jgi:Mn2+/Fe2+ NRAMP family transporter
VTDPVPRDNPAPPPEPERDRQVPAKPAARPEPGRDRQAPASRATRPEPPRGPPASSKPLPARSGTLAQPQPTGGNTSAGDIEGALGRIRATDEQRSGWRRQLVTFLAIVGPGLIVMVGDNDAGGVATYAQAGQNYGYSLLWVLLLLVPVLIVNQEMVVRLGAVTGVGHAKLIYERFGKFWGSFSVIDLFVLNFLTIVTEFIGISLAMRSQSVHLRADRRRDADRDHRERELQALGTGDVPVHRREPGPVRAAGHLLAPEPRGHRLPLRRAGRPGRRQLEPVLLIIAVVGTTVAPWQLFFQQSNVIDKRITPRFIRYERADTFLGSLVVIVSATVILIATVYAVAGTPRAGHFIDALGVAEAFRAKNSFLGSVFALVLLDASVIGAAAVTLSTSYAFGDVFNLRHSLHRKFRDAKAFYASYTLVVVLAAGIVLVPGAPLGLFTTAVQALAGVLLPSASVFLLLLCNDPQVLGPWTNTRWLNVVAGLIIGLLLTLSGTLVITTLFPSLSAPQVLAWIAVALGVGSAVAYGWLRFTAVRRAPAAATRVAQAEPGRAEFAEMTRAERVSWRMPPLALLKPVIWSPLTKLTIAVLWAYLVISVLLLIVKAIQLGTGG